ncbi:GTPase activating protein 1-like, partial [Alnus glutinosa]|uniref:GTPase activating protein 1-like n=1 Tax=Alnus glutinosa TaxID=3517 RepID=UPI002D76BC87
IQKGVNLAVRDVRSSDPYVIVKMGRQKLKTRVVKKNINPEWNEDLTLSIADPSVPIKLVSVIVLVWSGKPGNRVKTG